eukprot:gb/GECG01007696.1/.p1 GENE.gb/GECG01007696.1/~~gb/GECG01007696.1/.p1  ORF type:complete len:477 (+),score=59.82 gb/GECG01007696.1/:1-1431(+)
MSKDQHPAVSPARMAAESTAESETSPSARPMTSSNVNNEPIITERAQPQAVHQPSSADSQKASHLLQPHDPGRLTQQPGMTGAPISPTAALNFAVPRGPPWNYDGHHSFEPRPGESVVSGSHVHTNNSFGAPHPRPGLRHQPLVNDQLTGVASAAGTTSGNPAGRLGFSLNSTSYGGPNHRSQELMSANLSTAMPPSQRSVPPQSFEGYPPQQLGPQQHSSGAWRMPTQGPWLLSGIDILAQQMGAYYRDANARLSPQQIMDATRHTWDNLHPGVKSQFEGLAEQENQRIAQSMHLFPQRQEPRSGQEDGSCSSRSSEYSEQRGHTKPRGRPPKPKTEKSGPKRPMSAFLWFSKEKRPEIREEKPGLPLGELTKELSRRWKALSEAECEKWKTAAQKDKLRYEQERLEWEQQTSSSPQKRTTARKHRIASLEQEIETETKQRKVDNDASASESRSDREETPKAEETDGSLSNTGKH